MSQVSILASGLNLKTLGCLESMTRQALHVALDKVVQYPTGKLSVLAGAHLVW